MASTTCASAPARSAASSASKAAPVREPASSSPCPVPPTDATHMNAVAKLPTRKISVILADDHPVVRDGLAAIVNQQPDMQVVAEAGDGAEALELYEQHLPDVMVLDLRMPKLDGAAVVQKVLEKHPKACLL